MVLFERATFLTGVIAAQSRNMPAKLKASRKLGGVQKKSHGHNFGHKIVPVTFFWTPHFHQFFFLKFDPTSGANNSTLKTARPKKFYIFGILGRKLSHGTPLDRA